VCWNWRDLFNPRNRFEDFSEVERRILGVPHTQQRLSPELLRSACEKFEGFMGPEGARFVIPMRVDLLHRPPV